MPSRLLGSLVQAVPGHVPEILAPLLAACKDSEDWVRRDAIQALGEFSLQQFIEGYWATQNQGLIPVIATQPYRTPLLVRTSPKPHHQEVVLYPAAGQRVEWKKPHEEVQNFVKLIKDAAKQKQ